MEAPKQPVIADALVDQWFGRADPQTAFADQQLAGSEGNSRIGYGSETVLNGTGKIGLDIHRDRQSSFDPRLIAE